MTLALNYDNVSAVLYDKCSMPMTEEQRLEISKLICEWFRPAALAVAPPANDEGWRPVETAPKDGTEILVTVASVRYGFMQVVFWDVEGWNVKDAPYTKATCHHELFTHWRPLPPPPKEP